MPRQRRSQPCSSSQLPTARSRSARRASASSPTGRAGGPSCTARSFRRRLSSWRDRDDSTGHFRRTHRQSRHVLKSAPQAAPQPQAVVDSRRELRGQDLRGGGSLARGRGGSRRATARGGRVDAHARRRGLVRRLRRALRARRAAGLLAASTDSVGSKLVLSRRAGRLRDAGRDLAAHCIDDVLTTGAEPLFLLDYVAAHELDLEQVAELVEGAAEVCRDGRLRAARRRDGGAARRLPRAGARLRGHVRRASSSGTSLIDGSRCEPGDVVLGLPSSGLHTNGFSLVRAPRRRATTSTPTSCSRRTGSTWTRCARCGRGRT